MYTHAFGVRGQCVKQDSDQNQPYDGLAPFKWIRALRFSTQDSNHTHPPPPPPILTLHYAITSFFFNLFEVVALKLNVGIEQFSKEI